MFWDDPYQKQIIKNIESLIAAKEFQKAQDACNEILESNPDNTKVIRMLDIIDRKVQEENEDKINAAMKDLAPLWEKEEYSKIIRKLHELKEYSPNYEPLIQEITRAETEYRVELNKEQEKEVEEVKKSFEKLFSEDKLDDVIQKCHELENSRIKNEELVAYSKEIRKRLIDTQLANKKDFLAGDHYDEILSFLEGLSQISPGYKKVSNLIEEIKLRKVNNVSLEQEETSFEAVDNVKTLLKLGKYEEALVAAKELQIYNPSSKVVDGLVKEAEEKFHQEMDEETSEQIKESEKKMKEEREKNPDDYTTL